MNTNQSNPSAQVVTSISHSPTFEVLEPKEIKKARMGEPVYFPIDVVVEKTGTFSKTATVKPSNPDGNTFRIMADEPASVGGGDSAPSPMAYFTAGAALCLMSHVAGYIRIKELDVRSVKIEMRGNFMTGMGHMDKGGQGEGGAENIQTYVILDSDEPPDVLKELVEVCEKACIANQTICKAVPTSATVMLNGKKL